MTKKAEAQRVIDVPAEVVGPALLEPNDPWRDVKEAKDMSSFSKAKVLLYGPSGGGKTRIAAAFKRPLIGCTELQGVPTITRMNPNAMVHPIQTPDDMARFKDLIFHPKMAERCDAVCLDGITDVQRIIRAYYLSRQTKGQDTIHMDTWGKIIDSTAGLVRQIRDLPVHVIVTALDEEENVEGEGRCHKPSVNGKKLPNDLAQYFNLVGYVYKRGVQRAPGVRHEVMFTAPDRYMSKGMPELQSVEPPEPQSWVSKIFGTPLDPAVAARVAEWERLGLTNDEAAPAPTPDAAVSSSASPPASVATEDPFAARSR